MIERRPAVAELLKDRGNALVVAGLGSPVYDVCAAGDHDLTFYDWGAMGSAAMVGLGLALSRPDRPVVVFTGDGEMLMGLGSFSTIVQHQPANLSILVLDNEQYAETGMQKTATGFGTNLAAVARACGIKDASVLTQQNEVSALRPKLHAKAGTLVAVLKIKPGDQPRTVPEREGTLIASRFMQHLAAGDRARV
ncbi:thiamine pyrophosphate-dependent enzyme [Bradyrhizobium sp.]|uniref:thiamine pyrophosphate-dependent enzyme n=1 Tax=Bradyrhizobium sp. TaxID=376 RepID=UPI002C33E21F|nr:thiamine pyrophosphate-dependent enzyme [Bradyrhizobium sp.]HMM89327.1 thiamine pyrophosphate-dependent enzyme [Bradyrhizobium sp.]